MQFASHPVNPVLPLFGQIMQVLFPYKEYVPDMQGIGITLREGQ